MTPYGLQTEHRTEPLGLGDRHPRLSWKLDSERRGAAQRAYRITAARREEDLDVASGLLWDSGRRDSADTLLIPWQGPALRSAARYHWRVEVWDESGAPAGSAQSWFETGLLDTGDWTAAWIGRDPQALPPVDPPTDDDIGLPGAAEAPLYLRTHFRLSGRPVRARLYATARGVYEAGLNGTRVGDHELAPGWASSSTRGGPAPGPGRPPCSTPSSDRWSPSRTRRSGSAPTCRRLTSTRRATAGSSSTSDRTWSAGSASPSGMRHRGSGS